MTEPTAPATVPRRRSRSLSPFSRRSAGQRQQLATAIVTHAYWSQFASGDVLAARTALKHHHEQQMADASS
ncbi:hypothetical protein OG806_00715 [Streptomyces sp. NBC_00882]|uniref:hypothetical protein n=1 Tax=Streptomyces sp. NBC_00882 TaxID=2975856 RepID=UPI003869AB1B|nr:hypothetical protein OG806_00715 [Streptomyces sp. NBC_00882]